MKKTVFLAVLYFSMLGCLTKIGPEPVIDYAELGSICIIDSDCVKVDAGCCGCNAGDSRIAINKKYTEEWKQQLNCTGDIACIQVVSSDPSCFDEQTQAKCVQGTCKIV